MSGIGVPGFFNIEEFFENIQSTRTRCQASKSKYYIRTHDLYERGSFKIEAPTHTDFIAKCRVQSTLKVAFHFTVI